MEEEPVTPEGSSSARQRIEASLEGLLDRETLDLLLREVLAITKSARGWCGTCGKAVTVEIPDAKAVVAATSEPLVQAAGRPGQVQPDGAQVLVSIVYNVPEQS